MPDMFLGIANAAPVGVLAISRDGGIRFTNAALCKIFGYAESTLIGLPVETLLPETAQTGHRHLRQSFFASPSSRGMGEGRMLFGRHATGRLIPVEIGLGSTGAGMTRSPSPSSTIFRIKNFLRSGSPPSLPRCPPGCC